MAFAHLHVHSQFSILDGAIPVKKLAGSVAKLGQTSVALTDHCNLYGAVAFDKSCKGEGIHPVFGSGLWWQPEGLDFEDPREGLGGHHLIALIKDKAGYRNLCHLITRAIFDGMHYKPRVDLALLEKHREGLIFLTSGMRGPVRGPIVSGEPEKARDYLSRLAETFGEDHLYVELQDVGFDADLEANEGARALAADLGLRTVVTNAVHYLTPEKAPVLEVLQCIGTGTSINDPKRRRPVTDQLYLKTEEEMRALFPDDGPALDITAEIAERCQYKFTYGTYYFPASEGPDKEEGADTDANWDFFYRAFPPPRDFGLPDPEAPGAVLPPRPDGAGNLDGYFRWYCEEGLRLRLKRIEDKDGDNYKIYWDRLEVELGIVKSMGFPAYFLIVAEFINWAKDRDIPVGPGRGSAAGSLCAYATRITDIDPIRFDLLFERFLNPERISMPDVDVDFCQDRREEVIEHTREKYGYDYVAQIITYGKLQAKLAIRDVARICDLTFNDADRIAKLVPDELGISLEKAVNEEGLAHLMEADMRVRRIVTLAQGVEGLTRQTGVHAAGVVAADRPLVDLVPLYRDGPDGGPVVQFDMKSAEAVGLIKFDFLGLKTLDQIRDAVAMIARNTGEVIDMSDIPVDDQLTYDLLQRGDGLGVFQVESSGMRELLTKLKPSVLDDVIALVALYRPGPLDAGMVDDFVERKHGRQRVEYPLPELEPILRNTYGVVVYQEQVMQIAQVLASYSLGEADILRRAMGKKDAAEMDRQSLRFVDGAKKNGHDPKKAQDIFDLLAMFAAYGFNKSHSAAYGYISYQTAYLKANHRAEYMAALMSIESSNTDKVLIYLGDCRRSGIEVLPPDVNHSLVGFDVPKDDRKVIRFGLGAVKNVGTGAVEAIIEARDSEGGSFKDMMAFLEALDFKRVNTRVLENLVKCGAFDWTDLPRAALAQGLDGAIKAAQSAQRDKAAGQASMFALFGAGSGGEKPPTYRFPDVAEWPVAKRLGAEKVALGFFISGHPVQAYAEEVEKFATCRIHELRRVGKPDQTVRIAGMPSAMRQVRTKRGDKMAFVTLEDETGSLECIFFSEPWANSAKDLKSDQPVVVTGKLEKSSDSVKILAEGVELLATLRLNRTKEVQIRLTRAELESPRQVKAIKALLDKCSGRCRARIKVEVPGRAEVWLKLGEGVGVRADDELSDGIAALLRRNGAVSFR